MILRECVTLKDEKIEKPLTVAVMGAGVILGTKISSYKETDIGKKCPC